MVRRLAAAAAAMAMLATTAQAACWTRDEASAAGIRQLQSMLMVTALRCRAAGEDMLGDYNRFVAASRAALATENDRIRSHFIVGRGAIAGQQAYDSFNTSMANGYGAGAGAPASCRAAATLAREAGAMAGSRDALLTLVARLGLEAPLPEGRCGASAPLAIASAAPAAELPYPGTEVAAETVAMADLEAPMWPQAERIAYAAPPPRDPAAAMLAGAGARGGSLVGPR